MRSEKRQSPRTRRIILPSGRTIELASTGSGSGSGMGSGSRTGRSRAARELHICPACASPLVQPLRWTQLADGRFELTLRCPNCGRRERDAFERAAVERFEDRLDDGLSKMIADLRQLAHANMAAELERFTHALEADLILPEDF